MRTLFLSLVPALCGYQSSQVPLTALHNGLFCLPGSRSTIEQPAWGRSLAAGLGNDEQHVAGLVGLARDILDRAASAGSVTYAGEGHVIYGMLDMLLVYNGFERIFDRNPDGYLSSVMPTQVRPPYIINESDMAELFRRKNIRIEIFGRPS